MAYRSLHARREQARFDPMITGFNPADMYAADHIRRVLQTFPGVFTRDRRVHDPQGVRLLQGRGRDGEPAPTRRSTASSTSRARSGLVVLLHNDIDMPFPKPGQDPYPAVQLGELLRGATRRRRSSGRTAGSAASCIRCKDQLGDRRARARRSRARPRLHRHLVGRGREVPRGDAGVDRRPRPTSSTATPTASCSAPTRSRRRTRPST